MQGAHHKAQILSKTAFSLKLAICLFIFSAVVGISSILSQKKRTKHQELYKNTFLHGLIDFILCFENIFDWSS